jgi:hypothetical protein
VIEKNVVNMGIENEGEGTNCVESEIYNLKM